MIKLLCLDYDMTLFDHNTQKIPESALEAIGAIRDRCKIVLASGRFMDDPRNAPIRDLLRPDGIIHANGSKVEADGQVLSETYLDPEDLKSLLDYGYANRLCLGYTYEGTWYSTNIMEQEKRWKKRGLAPHPKLKDAAELYDKKIPALFLDGSVEAAGAIEKAFPGFRAPIMNETAGGADVVPVSLSKAIGMKTLMDFWKEPAENVAAIGDSMNDYEMIKEAGTGIAMGNAVTALKEAADFVTSPIGEDGVKNAILRLFPSLTAAAGE